VIESLITYTRFSNILQCHVRNRSYTYDTLQKLVSFSHFSFHVQGSESSCSSWAPYHILLSLLSFQFHNFPLLPHMFVYCCRRNCILRQLPIYGALSELLRHRAAIKHVTLVRSLYSSWKNIHSQNLVSTLRCSLSLHLLSPKPCQPRGHWHNKTRVSCKLSLT
jgi:hypothetical protein